ncbi:MAG: hypothetical protein ACOYLF_17725 [Blastocatellia bacterium]
MGLWIDALRLGAQGRSDDARFLIATDLRLSLCDYSTATVTTNYTGPLPSAVRRFAIRLNPIEHSMVKSLETEFIDYLLDDILLGILRPLTLIDFCRANPEGDLETMVKRFPWWQGLKRNEAWKSDWIADHIRSIDREGIELPSSTIRAIGDLGRPRHEYNEIAFATAPQRLSLAWGDFRRDLGPLAGASGIVDEISGTDIANESLNYGAISMAQIVSTLVASHNLDLELDLERMGSTASREIKSRLADLYQTDPQGCHRPLAWHNVFWMILSKYEPLPLDLETRDPLVETDEKLASYLASFYLELEPLTRGKVRRRRLDLTGICLKSIYSAVEQLFRHQDEHPPVHFTH